MITMEELYEEFIKRPVGSKFITASDRNTIELMENTYKVGISRRKHGSCGSSLDVAVEIKKKDKFSGFFGMENVFVWHLENQEDVDLLINKIEKIPDSIMKEGPYDFSRRSTYIKKMGGPFSLEDNRRNPSRAVACSGNFVLSASVVSVVVLDEKGKLQKDLHTPGKDAWFEIVLGTARNPMGIPGIPTMNPSTFGINNRGSCMVVYNTERWWPVDTDKMRATSVLSFTEGKLLTMHDKFVLDLAVKAFNGG